MKVTEDEYREILKRSGVRKNLPEKIKKVPQQREYEEQVALFRMAEQAKVKYPELELLNGSLNGVRLNIGQSVKAKRTGMKKGYPDVFLPVPRGRWHGLFVELKVKGGSVRPEQKGWFKRLLEQGYFCTVCWSGMDAFDEIVAYLNHGGKDEL